MTVSDILEHWATIYSPIGHKPGTDKLEDQRFFRIRYIDMENIFDRNFNVIRTPCMLQSITSTGKVNDPRHAVVAHQVWFLAKVKDTSQTLGRFDGMSLQRTSDDLITICEDFIAYILQLRKTQICPVTNISFKGDPVTAQELACIDIDTFDYGVVPDLYKGQFLIAGVSWEAVKPIFNFACGANGKYILPDTEQQ